MEVTLTRMTPDPLMAVEEAASQCYQSKPSPQGKIMKQCYLSGHLSVFEHVSFTWHIEGIDRAILAQLSRHRVGIALSVESQRYVNQENFSYTVPKWFASTPLSSEKCNDVNHASMIYHSFMTECNKTYQKLIALGMPKEDARSVLPNACCVNLQLTMNLRELMHFANERLCSRAQDGIREMCHLMVREVNKATQNAFAFALVPKCERHPDYPFCTEGRKGCGCYPTLEQIYSPNRKDDDE